MNAPLVVFISGSSVHFARSDENGQSSDTEVLDHVVENEDVEALQE